jgi:hypothetical protein
MMVLPHNNFDFLLTGNAWAIIGIFSGVSFFIGYIFSGIHFKAHVGWIKLMPKEEINAYKSQYTAEMQQRQKLNELANKNPLKGV